MKKMNLTNKDPIISMVKESLGNLPTPVSISFMWNMGFLLGMVLSMQILTGVVLSMNYVPSVDQAFSSVIHIMRDIEYGWIMRYMHMNGASMFFIFMYTHISRGIYFNSPSKTPMVWMSGIIILLVSMMTAFMGYVLPWGQMSFWGATVITSMVSAVPYLGSEITMWIWGNFSISQPTLNRFFSLHFILPLVILMMVLIHLILLHESGSSNPTGTNPDYDKMKFVPYFAVKDINPMIFSMVTILTVISLNPNMLGDVENFIIASSTVTPNHIQPEWYFLFAYAILRSVPSKLGGVTLMGASILVLALPMMKVKSMNKKFSPLSKTIFWMFLVTVFMLSWIGSNPVEPPLIQMGQALTTLYFLLVYMI